MSTETITPGNVAKLREVVQELRTNALYGRGYSPSMVVKICDEALAAPARNCDRFGGNPKMLRTEWWDWTGSPSGHNPDGTAKLTFGDWLLENSK